MNYSRRFFPGLAVVLLATAGCATFDGGKSTWRDAERPLVNAHRGGTFEYDDNALGGFRRCLAAGVRGFETDVQLTKDDRLVIMHDKDIARTTTGKGSAHDLTLDELMALKLKKSGENVPSARQVAISRPGSGVRMWRRCSGMRRRSWWTMRMRREWASPCGWCRTPAITARRRRSGPTPARPTIRLGC